MTRKLSYVIILALICLTGCASGPASPRKLAAKTPTEQFTQAVKVASRPDAIALAPHVSGLSATQGEALDALVARWRDMDGDVIAIDTAGDSGHLVAAQTRVLLLARGVPEEDIIAGVYDAAGQSGAPVRVSFTRYEAELPRCGENWGNLTATASNGPSSNFGCAVTANIAAQIADPRDLLRPRTSTPVDGQRRAVVFDKYRKGEKTSSVIEEQALGSISQVVK